MPAQPITNALTIDVEDYFQVSAFAPYIARDDWERRECRVERNVARILDMLAARIPAAIVETAACTHGGGPPICWCRPPLPGLPLAFARRHGVDPGRSLLAGTSTAHRALATALGSTYVDVSG